MSESSEDDIPDVTRLDPHETSTSLRPHNDVPDRTQPVIHAMPEPEPYELPVPSTHQNSVAASNAFLISVDWEGILGAFTPYLEMSKPSCDYEKVLKGLLSEWCMVNASLLGSAA